jgi:hypothetical protein
MEALRLNTIIKKDGEIVMRGLPYKKGEQVEMILLAQPSAKHKRRALTSRQLRRSALIGLWKDRDDIKDSASFARQLREQAQTRRR